LECGKFLSKLEGSLLGPEPRKGVLGLKPVVFYSPRLNTCLLINSYIVADRDDAPPYRTFRIKHVALEDLLTGRTIEYNYFDLDVPEQAKAAAADFEGDAMRRYGPEADSK
jgi:hypothetical protein